MKTILVPTDFSKCAYVAAHFAVELARITKAKIILVNTFQIPIPPPDSLVTPISFAELKEESLKQLKRMADFELRENKDVANLEIHVEALLGNTVDEIIEAAKKYKADLIVMGTHGASGILDNVMGTNTANLLAQSPCPTLAIPEHAHFTGLKKLAFAVDFNEIYENDAIHQLIHFAKTFNCQLDLFQIISQPNQKGAVEKEIERIKLIKIFDTIPHVFHTILNENIPQAIEFHLNESKADALVTMPHKHNFLGFLFGQSVTRQLSFHLKKPLLCLPFYSN